MGKRNFKLTITRKSCRQDLRHLVHQKATKLKIIGYICTLSDIGTEILAEGEEISLNALISYVKELLSKNTKETIPFEVKWDKSPVEECRFTIKHSL